MPRWATDARARGVRASPIHLAGYDAPTGSAGHAHARAQANPQPTTKEPRRKRRSISEEGQLAVLVWLLVVLALLLDVVADHRLICVSADRARKIAIRPKLP